MTGPLQINPVHLGNGQVVGGGAAPDPWAAFLQSLLQGAQQGSQGYIAGEDRKQRGEQLDLEKQKLAFHIAQEKTKQEQERTKGAALQAFVAKMGMAQDAQSQAHDRAMAPMPVTGQPFVPPQPGGTGWTPQNNAPLPAIQQTPGVGQQRPAGPASGQSDPFQMLSSVMAGQVTPATAADFLKDVHPMFQDAVKRDAQAKADAKMERAIAVLPADKQEAARSVIQFAKMGANLPSAMQQQLWPNLFPPGQTVDPQQLNAASTLYKTGAFTWKQAAREAGIETNADAPRYVPPVNPLARALMSRGVRDRQFANLSTEMEAADVAINAWEEKHPEGLSFVGQLQKDGQGSGFFNAIKRAATRGVVKDEEQTAITAMVDYSLAWGHAISGARLVDSQLERIIHNTTVENGDPPLTVQYKRNMRAVMKHGMADIARGVRSPVEVLKSMENMPWTPDQKRMLREMKGQAIRYEREILTGKAPAPLSSITPDNLDDLQEQVNQLGALLTTQLPTPEP